MGYVIGLMSGTSLDGIDAALVDIQGNGRQSQVRLVDFLTLPFTPAEVDEIMACMDLGQSNVARICSLNFSLGYKFAEAAKAVLARNGISAREVLAIGSHGQTLYHQPKQEGNLVPSTLQVGEPAVIAYETKIPVVSNFRTMDMAAGGQG
ncbi:MAG: anhydro-N-acetylmuramic acid kinase, partial [Turicibacter sp.]|nr:anhydro-N-acetylmuramic acid kinase [Turicibacter sp.]